MENKKMLKGTVFGILLLFGYLLMMGVAKGSIDNEYLSGTAVIGVQVLVLGVAHSVMKRSYGISLGFSSDKLKKGVFCYGLMMFIIILGNLWLEYEAPQVNAAAAVPKVLFCLAAQMGVGLAEEVIMRGVLFNVFKSRFGETRKGIFLAMLISSLIFGMIHFVNLINDPQLLVATISQVIYATFLGCFFCMVYYRSGNLWASIILHGLVDFTSEFWECFEDAKTAAQPEADYPIWIGIVSVAVCALLFISAIVQLRNEFAGRAKEPALS